MRVVGKCNDGSKENVVHDVVGIRLWERDANTHTCREVSRCKHDSACELDLHGDDDDDDDERHTGQDDRP